MSKQEVKVVKVVAPLKVVGKDFKGAYENASLYIQEIQKDLRDAEISFIPNKVFGIYYDNPQQTKREDLRSFQAVFPGDEVRNIPSSLSTFQLKGDFLYVKVVGNPVQTIMQGYGALFQYMRDTPVQVASNAGYQILTFENGLTTTEIFMELKS